ncbi:MAG: hypothetical protein K8H88_06590, partial [Sandaracinaceae bacterium]|nr:hypothetical protein [Sandaracinaceae bacterium]
MQRIVFRLGLFEQQGALAYSRGALGVLVRALFEANVAYLIAHPRTPAFAEVRVRHAPSVLRCASAGTRQLEWRGVESILREGAGDAVSLACWACAERALQGERVRPVLRWSPWGHYDVVLQAADGTIEDVVASVLEREGLSPALVIGPSHLQAPATEIAFRLRLFRGEPARHYSERVLSVLLRTLVRANLLYLRTHDAPRLYEAGVHYEAEPYPQEEWKGIAAILADGQGDCEDLATYRAAELLAQGERARPVFRWRPVGPLSVYHILVR